MFEKDFQLSGNNSGIFFTETSVCVMSASQQGLIEVTNRILVLFDFAEILT